MEVRRVFESAIGCLGSFLLLGSRCNGADTFQGALDPGEERDAARTLSIP